MRHLATAALILFTALTASGQDFNKDPDSAELVTSDIDNFWRAYDKARDVKDPVQREKIFDTDYISQGSIGLKGFIPHRIVSAKALVKHIDRYPRFYASIRGQSRKVTSMKPGIYKSFRNLDKIYPDAIFPNVYFLIGRINSGGTISQKGLLIGTEMYCKTDSTPMDELTDWHRAVLAPIENVPYIVAHELIHYQQRSPQKTLLEKAIQEGGADFIAELIAGKHINQQQHAYGNKHEDSLWAEFKKEMHGNDYSRWLYDGDRAKDRPSDMAYYVGYKIVESFYRNSKDKKAAVARILNFKNASQFLKESAYESKFAS